MKVGFCITKNFRPGLAYITKTSHGNYKLKFISGIFYGKTKIFKEYEFNKTLADMNRLFKYKVVKK